MLNYIKSEMYRTVRNRNLKIFIGICVALLLSMVMILFYYRTAHGFPYATTKFTMSFITSGMSTLLLLTIVVALIIDNNEYKNHTIKHTVSFGMNRMKMYFARFCAMLINSILVYIEIIAFLAITSFLFLNHAGFAVTMTEVLRVSLAAFPCLVAGIAMTYFFMMLFDNPTVSMVWIVGILLVLPKIMGLLGMKFDIFDTLVKYTPIVCLSANGKMISSIATDVTSVLTTVGVGLGWSVAFLALGAIFFQKQELK